MVKIHQFMGIKAAHLLPIVAVAFFMVAGLPMLGRPLPQVYKDIAGNVRRFVSHPLFIWHIIAIVVGLGVVGFALLRTGNDSGLGVSSFELHFRSILDKLIGVRPRTKEFLIGHPALMIGIAFLMTRKRSWGLPLICLGVLGQASLLNTFCHIHTPLLLSTIRAWNGLVIGTIVGFIIWWLIEKCTGDGGQKQGNL
jgi:Na+/proline symporter